MMKNKILVVDDEPDIRELLKDILEDENYLVAVAQNGAEARTQFHHFNPDLVLLDIWMPDVDGISLLKEWHDESNSNSSIVMMSGHGTVETAIEATKLGAKDFIEKPISMAKLLATVKASLSYKQAENVDTQSIHFEQIVGSSQIVTQLKKEIETHLTSAHPVFIMAPIGVGKRIVASHMAHQDNNINRIEWVNSDHFYLPSQHDKNTLFYLSDFAELSDLQLRQLTDFLLVNEFNLQKNHLKVVLSTSQFFADFADKVSNYALLREGWRFPIQIPLLNQHREDIPELLEYYSNWFSDVEELPYRHFSVAAQNLLRNHDWRGNLSELKALVRKLLSSQTDPTIEAEEVKSLLNVVERRASLQAQPSSKDTESLFKIDLEKDLKTSREEFERAYLELQLAESHGNISELARRSGQERTYLYRKIKALGIDTKK